MARSTRKQKGNAKKAAAAVPFGSQLKIAVVQLASAFPNEKVAAVVGTRSTWVWKSQELVDARIEKVLSIIDEIHRLGPDTDLIVFPEYTVPVLQVLPRLQEKARESGTVIVGGTDNIPAADGSQRVFNRCPIVFPDQKVEWVGKRDLAGPEPPFVDPDPSAPEAGLLSWRKGGRRYWMKVCICLDVAKMLESRLRTRKSPGFFLVPMSSPDMQFFWAYASTLLRSKHGRAVVLCNSIGAHAVGRSALVIVGQHAKHLHGEVGPVLEIPGVSEAVAFFTLDLDHLKPKSKPTVPPDRPGVLAHAIYTVRSSAAGLELSPIDDEEKTAERAIVNPALFQRWGRKMRIAFLQEPRYASTLGSTRKDLSFEVYFVLGHHDAIVTHLHPHESAMKFDISRVLTLLTPNGRQSAEVPHFEVEKYFKVLGYVVSEEDRLIDSHPSAEQLSKILALGSNWGAAAVTEEERGSFAANRWVLGRTKAVPGDIDAIMTLFLPFGAAELPGARRLFEAEVISSLVNEIWVTSLYGGNAHGDFGLRHQLISSSR